MPRDGLELKARALAKDPPEAEESTDGSGVSSWFSFDEKLRRE